MPRRSHADARYPMVFDFLGTKKKAIIAIAVATGAQFVREIFTGVFASDMGVWAPDCAGPARLRRNLGRPDLKLLFNINAEFAYSLDQRPIELRAKSAVFSSLADAILV